jgi:hypothetical protein
MKVFDGKKAAVDYMSAHTLTFSTPDLTLKRFAFWLGDMVPDPENKEEAIPRLYTYVEEKDFAPVEIIDEENYVPTGAVKTSGMYGNQVTETDSDVKFCSECGVKISVTAKFCTECGTTQD